MKSVYIIGSLANPEIVPLANRLRAQGLDVFDDWISGGSECDRRWEEYEKARGRSFIEALQGYHAKHVFEFDKFHLDRCDAAVMVMPCGKSGWAEMAYTRGRGKPAYILATEDISHFDVMIQFCTKIFTNEADLVSVLKEEHVL